MTEIGNRVDGQTAGQPVTGAAVGGAALAIAPMLDRTDRHFRYLARLLAPQALLYTEMVVARAILRGDRAQLLDFDPAERPLVLQLGGSDPAEMAAAAVWGERHGYDAINLNIGCPSDRVQSGRFGACLMASPDQVAACVRAIRAVVAVPVTIKTRIGIDEHDDYAYLRRFIEPQIAAGCRHFVVHARKAILDGLSPAENRSIPPLRYDVVYRLKQDYPALHITINGGIRTTGAALEHLHHVDGIMIGRQAYKEPYWLAELDAALHGEVVAPTRAELVHTMAAYAADAMAGGARLNHIVRHMLGLYAGMPGARAWRRFLSERVNLPGAGPELLIESLACLPGA